MKRTGFAVAGLALVLGAGAFWDGLYAGGQQLAAVAVMAVLALGAGGPLPLALTEALLLVALAAGSLLSLLHPAAAGNAAHGPVLVAGWLLAFWVGRRSAGAAWLEALLNRIFSLVGPLMVFGGLAAMSYLPAHQSGRLPSFLGYPIALGMLGLLGLAGTLPDLKAGRGWAPLLAWANLVGVLLSGSRGVWAVAFVLLAYLAWADRELLRPLWWPAVAALTAALWIGPYVVQRALLPALLAFVLTGLTVAAAGWFRGLRVPVAFLMAAAAVPAPGWGWLMGRATALIGTEGSSVERMTFIRDGLRLAAHRPLGAGYRAWTALHLQGASYSYYSAEVHSAPLDLTLAYGWLAGLAFLILLGRYLWGLRQGRRWGTHRLVLLAGLGALGLHSLLDWDLSYALFAIPLWLGFGLMESPVGVRVDRRVAAALAGLALAGAIILGAGDVAVELSGTARDAGKPDLARRHGALAVAVTPWNDLAHATYGQALSALGRRDEAVAEFGAARRLGSYEPWYAELQAYEYRQTGRLVEAAAAYRDEVALWPWYVPVYEAALSADMDMLFRAQVMGNQALAAELTESGRAVLAALDRQKAKEPPGRPRKPMGVHTPVIEQARDYFR